MQAPFVKTYRSLRFMGLQTHAKIDENRKVLVEFKGGARAPRKVNGTFTTSIKEVQDALENSNQYGVDWTLINKVENPRYEGEKNENVPAEDTNAGQTESNEGKKESGGDLKQVPGITKVQDAKEYLQQHYSDSVSSDDVKNKESVLNAAKRLGLEFPDMG